MIGDKVEYLGAYAYLTDKGTIPMYCFCGRGKACKEFTESGYSTGNFCEECEDLIEMTDAQALWIASGYSTKDSAGRKINKHIDWLKLIKGVSCLKE